MNLRRPILLGVAVVGAVSGSLMQGRVHAQQAASAAEPPLEPYAGLARTLDPAITGVIDDAAFLSRFYVALTWLHTARQKGTSPDATIRRAMEALGYSGAGTDLSREMLIRALAKLDAAAVFSNPANWTELTSGRPPTIEEGIYKGEKLVAGFIVPPVRAPQFARAIANVELLPTSEVPKSTAGLLTTKSRAHLERLETERAPEGTIQENGGGTAPVVAHAGAAPAQSAIQKLEIPVGQVLDLAPFTGQRYGLVVNGDTTSEIRYGITDFSSYITVARIDAYGYPYTARVPRSNEYTREKRDGREIAGFSGKAYPIFELDGIVRVYFLDTLARSDNQRVLLIETFAVPAVN